MQRTLTLRVISIAQTKNLGRRHLTAQKMNTQKIYFFSLLVLAMATVLFGIMWYAVVLHVSAGALAFNYFFDFRRGKWTIAKTGTLALFLIMGFCALLATIPNRQAPQKN